MGLFDGIFGKPKKTFIAKPLPPEEIQRRAEADREHEQFMQQFEAECEWLKRKARSQRNKKR